MPNPTRLLRRWPRVSEAELDAARSITLARLTAILEDGTAPDEDAAAVEEAVTAEAAVPSEATEPGDDLTVVGAEALEEHGAPQEPVAAGTAEIADSVVVADAETAATGTPLETDEVAGSDAAVEPEIPVVMAETVAAEEALAVELGVHRNGRRPAGSIRATPPIVVIGDEDDNGFASVPVDETPVSVDAGPPVAVDPDSWDLPPARDESPVQDEAPVRDEALVPEEPPVPDEPSARAEMPGAEAPLPTKPARRATRSVAARVVATRPATTRPRAAIRPSRGTAPHAPQPAAGPVAVVASCPYCALLLDPPPEADRRCVRCRQRIMVKRVQGRAVYLTEAAVEVFEAERRRVANLGHWTRDRGRWLKLAASVGAPAGRIDRLERAALSDEVVAAARSLYEATVERRVRVARRDRRWDEASRLRLDQALALYRVAGSPLPPSDDVVALHREGALAALRGLGDIAKEAAVIGAGCCEPCRADDGRSFRISRELREPRLPHAGCPKGLCRCRWDLTTRDRNLVGGYLRRHVRSNRVTPSA